MNPAVILFDEVTAALDPETVDELLQKTIKELTHEGMTHIWVTYEIGFAREVAEHICFTDHVVIGEHGPTKTFFTEAKDTLTKEFLSRIL